MKHILLVVLISLTSVAVGNYENSKEEKSEGLVLELTEQNFESVINEHDYVFVEFYVESCGACQQLAPEYLKTAKILTEAKSPVVIAKVDAMKETSLVEKYNVDGYPTMFLFRKGIATPYQRDRTADEIVWWINKKIGPPARQLNSLEEVELFLAENPVTAIGFFTDQYEDDAETFLNVAEKFDDFAMGITSEEEVFQKYSAKNGDIVLFAEYEDDEIRYEGELKEDDLETFLSARSLPPVVEFTKQTAMTIFRAKINTILFFFVSKFDDQTKNLVNEAKPVAELFREKLRFVLFDINSELNQHILKIFKMGKKGPFMRIVNLSNLSEMTKFKPESEELTTANIQKFANGFVNNKIERYFPSQDLPEDWNEGPVYTLVTDNFNSVAFDTEKDVLVEFYAPWCTVCQSLAPAYERVGEYFKDEDGVIIAKIDATANELPSPSITSVPKLVLYKKDQNEMIEYNGPLTFEGILEFVKSRGVNNELNAQDIEDQADDETSSKDEL